MRSNKFAAGLLAVGTLLLGAAPAMANPFLVASESTFSYSGTVTRQSDNQVFSIPSFVSTPGSTLYNGRDAAIYMANGAPTSLGANFENASIFETNWFGNSFAPNGSGNPNNSNVGFVQLNDQFGTSSLSKSGGWTDAQHKTIKITVTGANAGADAFAQLWPADSTDETQGLLDGTFLTYSLTLTATFADSATETLPGWFSTGEDPILITGTFSGTFRNENGFDEGLNGLYDFSFVFGGQNWARDNLISNENSYFGADAQPIPEPASLLLFGLGLAGLCFAWSKRKANFAGA